MRSLSALLLLVASCGGKTVTPSAPKPTPEPDRVACDDLCAREATCSPGGKASCLKTCEADRARMKPGFVAAYVRCYLPRLVPSAANPRCDDAARDAAHLACFDEALAGFPRDEQNQRDMAVAVCDRGERCMGLGKLGRAACMQATLDPKEAEVKLGQRLVDALARDRVVAFRACVDAAPCAKPGEADTTVDDCYAKTIARSS